jgi:hypothetical protein
VSGLTSGTAGLPGGYDVEQVAADARTHDPGLPPETAALLAREAGEHLSALGDPDAPEVARRLLADHPEAGASAAAVVARAACTHVSGDVAP